MSTYCAIIIQTTSNRSCIMGFREIRPQRNSSSANRKNTIRVSFPKIKATNKYNMNMYIGINVAHKLDFRDGDKISFNVDEDNPRIWLLKKAQDDVGFKLIDSTKNKDGATLRLQMTWNEYTPDPHETSVREVKHDMHLGGLRVFAHLT